MTRDALHAASPGSGLRIRSAAPHDVDALWAIEQDVFGSDAWSRALLEQELTGEFRTYLVLVDAQEQPVGYGGLLAVDADGDIQTIALAPAYRGKGLGRALMNALLDKAAQRGVRQVFLEVRADNPVARSLYESLGFAELGVRREYYQPDGVDAIVLRLEVKARQ